MVSAVFVDAINKPQETITELYENASSDSRDAFPATVASHFSEIFGSADAFNEIPIMSAKSGPEYHKDGTLVRFRGMIQDTSSSPEMYVSSSTDGKCGGWGIDSDIPEGEEVDYSKLKECAVVWAVSIPGETEWSQDENGHSNPSRSPLPQKYPISDAPHAGVQLKVYDISRAESFKSTDMYNFVGIFKFEPVLSDIDTPEPTTLPTLHVIYARSVSATITPRSYPCTSITDPESIRNELIDWIASESLAGDTNAAEWLLLTLIARVQSRTPSILPPSLTLSRFPSPSNKQTAPTLASIISALVPLFHHAPLSLSYLNKVPFSPRSSDSSDLHSGLLQLPQGSTLLLTEAGVSEGLLEQKGIDNVRAIQEVMLTQHLDYIFPFSRFTFETDINVVVLCEGKKSAFFQTTFNVPLMPDLAGKDLSDVLYKPDEQINFPPPKKLDAFRSLIGSAKVGSVKMGEDLAKFIENDFVSERKKERQKGEPAVTSEDLISWMTIAKLSALSLQKDQVTPAVWDNTKQFESRRRSLCTA